MLTIESAGEGEWWVFALDERGKDPPLQVEKFSTLSEARDAYPTARVRYRTDNARDTSGRYSCS